MKVNIDELKELDVFSNFPHDLLRELSRYIEPFAYSDGDRIISQGMVNNSVYILKSGKLGVYVDEGLVAQMGRPGDVFGEMGVITGLAASATIIAQSEVKGWRLDISQFDKNPDFQTDRFQHLIHRLYSRALTDKLKVTNQKAKHFEKLSEDLKLAQKELTEINLDLEEKIKERTQDLQRKTEDLISSNQKIEQRKAELLASHKKLEELYASKTRTFTKLQELQKKGLDPLSLQLEGLAKKVETTVRPSIESAHAQLEQVRALLAPITSLYSSELAMKAKRVLLADPNKKQQVIAKMALGGTGVNLQIASNPEEAKALADKEAFDIVFVDLEMLDFASKLRGTKPSTQVVLMTSEAIPKYLDKLKHLNFMPNVVSRDENDRTFTIKNIMTTVTKLSTEDIFGPECYLSWGVDILEQPIQRSDQRADLIQTVDKYFEGLGVRRTTRERCTTVLEELLMNAIYDAPVDGKGQSLYNHLSRTEVIQLKNEHHGRLMYGTDGVLVAISVSDPFGSLRGQTILDYLESCYTGRAGELNKHKGGAGRGLHQIVENSDLVVFNISPKVRTEVIALFNVDTKASADKTPSFHLFVK